LLVDRGARMLLAPNQLVVFGLTIRKERRDRELSQEALAYRAGLSPKHVGEIELAKKDPRLTTVLKLAHGLGMGPGELFAQYEKRIAR
jgi:transcriptional regulator with XRE-family HTH domain